MPPLRHSSCPITDARSRITNCSGQSSCIMARRLRGLGRQLDRGQTWPPDANISRDPELQCMDAVSPSESRTAKGAAEVEVRAALSPWAVNTRKVSEAPRHVTIDGRHASRNVTRLHKTSRNVTKRHETPPRSHTDTCRHGVVTRTDTWCRVAPLTAPAEYSHAPRVPPNTR